MILAGDIGGTKVNLALFSEKGEAPSLYVEKTYPSRDYPGLISILERFLKETQPKLTRVCLGVAGPVQDGRSRLTHLPWVIDIRDLKPLLQTDSIELINDMAVMACAVPHLVPDEVETLQPGEPDREGKIGVLAAGTGLGQAFLVPFGEGVATGWWKPKAGNATFPPVTTWKPRFGNFSVREPAGWLLRMCCPDRGWSVCLIFSGSVTNSRNRIG
ncbi:MAG: ROK family protein [Nitrospinaceae bacterium]|nr:ROK family protein [Nitrospinaceae bacterium]NIR57274.1 ROK family protein [Nitrospinaceae bacterium]NIS87726.1 ROK family protein [Nitrospinaceae bacterium]NIU46775.1 ROK family protein [Nitrospinaceae bacterium]NIU98973.1 ROK family protein [Nitrospinaceae bacterium]